jgi:hypothetical protein
MPLDSAILVIMSVSAFITAVVLNIFVYSKYLLDKRNCGFSKYPHPPLSINFPSHADEKRREIRMVKVFK